MPRTPTQWRVLLDAETDKTGDCWLWTGKRNKQGYGVVKSGMLAHRLAWQLSNAEQDPYPYLVCHTCDNRRCVKPNHIYLGTSKMNHDDAMRHGRAIFATPVSHRSLAAIQRRQTRRDVWDEAHQIEPSDLLGIESRAK